MGLTNASDSKVIVVSILHWKHDGMVWYGMVWKVNPLSSCQYRGLIDEVLRESRSTQHVTHLPSILART